MIFKNKSEIARHLGCGRDKIYRMIDNKEIKQINYYNGERSGYIIVLEFIYNLNKD